MNRVVKIGMGICLTGLIALSVSDLSDTKEWASTDQPNLVNENINKATHSNEQTKGGQDKVLTISVEEQQMVENSSVPAGYVQREDGTKFSFERDIDLLNE